MFADCYHHLALAVIKITQYCMSKNSQRNEISQRDVNFLQIYWGRYELDVSRNEAKWESKRGKKGPDSEV